MLVFKKTYSCLFIPNCTRNHVITYTNLFFSIFPARKAKDALFFCSIFQVREAEKALFFLYLYSKRSKESSFFLLYFLQQDKQESSSHDLTRQNKLVIRTPTNSLWRAKTPKSKVIILLPHQNLLPTISLTWAFSKICRVMTSLFDRFMKTLISQCFEKCDKFTSL